MITVEGRVMQLLEIAAAPLSEGKIADLLQIPTQDLMPAVARLTARRRITRHAGPGRQSLYSYGERKAS